MSLAKPECPTCRPTTTLIPRCHRRYTSLASVSSCELTRYRWVKLPSYFAKDYGGASSQTFQIAPSSWLATAAGTVAMTVYRANFHTTYLDPMQDTLATKGIWRLPQPACIPGCGAPVPGDPDQPPATAVGQIFVTDVTASDGIIGNKIWDPNTVPANTVLQECTSDTVNVEVHFMAEGGVNYSPTVYLDGTLQASNIQQYSNDRRLFYGSIPMTLSATQTLTLSSSAGGLATVKVNLATQGPSIVDASIGPYPGTQTAAKHGDVITVSGTAETGATHVRLIAYGAFESSNWVPVAADDTFSINGIVSSLNGLYAAQIEAKNSLGTVGATFTTTDKIVLDQAAPSIIDNGITYPAGQAAFKGTEQGIQSTTVSDFTSITYSSPNGDFSIASTTTYEQDKTLTCTNPAHYNDSAVNFKIVANKASNGTSTTFTKVIEVADVAPSVTVTQSSSRLRSSPFGTNYTITATSNQNLSSAPDIGIPVSGTWQGSGFTGGPKVYTRVIQIKDSDAKGSGAWVFNTVPTNNAGLPATISGTQVVGGFMQRDLILPAFGTTVQLGTAVVDTSKLQLSWTVKDPMLFQPIGTAPPVVSGWTIDAVLVNPTTVEILDTQAANSSSQDSVITIEEVV